MSRPLTVLVALTSLLALLCAPALAEKTKIAKLDDLPRYTYKIDLKAVEFIENDAAIMKLAQELKRDLLKDLEQFEIEDRTTLQGYYSNLGTIALLEGDFDTYLGYLAKRRELEDKEANKLTMGLVAEAYAHTRKSGAADFSAAFKERLHQSFAALPYEKVQDNIKQTKASFELMSRTLMLGGMEAGVQPVLDKSGGEMSKEMANGLLGAAYSLEHMLPVKDDVVAVVSEIIAAHQVDKPDIWADRDVELADGKYKPVIMCVWDSGVDAEVFGEQMWTNKKEKPGNNKDDDNNGFVDDVHGIAWSLHSDKETSLLFDVGDVTTERPVMQRRMKGLMDISSNIDSPEAKEVKELLGSLPQDSVKPVFEAIGKYGNYAHGTHVAGIAVRGNPFARVLAARLTFDYHMIPETPTVELARKDSAASQESVAYFKRSGVRVVNMSWGNDLKSIEHALEANNEGGTPDERKALARQIYEISRSGLYEAIKNAPEILFITSAGNADNDVNFEEFYPSSFDLPNMLTVGAVDQAGDETNFTSFGKVDVYANGFEVMSYVPGGDQMSMSGTSMSSPNVMNLAGKLLAKNPKLTTAQLRDLIVQGADERVAGERKLKLINPKKSFELLSSPKSSAAMGLK